MYVNGVPMPVEVGRSNTGAVFPSAVVDSGVPLILTTSAVANAIYGAIGISPGSDGNYYVPCTTPLNLTITLDDRPEIPLHPLDLTTEPPTGNQAQFCTGLIQADNADLAVANNKIGDMILGVPFMRNVYTVMAYTQPNSDGSFPLASNASSSSSSSSSSSAAAAVGLSSTQIQPRLGFLPLTDPTIALQEFRTVRVLNQPISSGTGGGAGGGGAGSSSSFHAEGGKKLSVGIIALLGLVGFFVVCLGMFGVWWFVVRRRYVREKAGVGVGDLGAGAGKAGYALADMPSEDRLRAMRYEAYLRKEERVTSGSTMSSGQTRVGGGAGGGGVDENGNNKKFGDDEPEEDIDIWDPKTALAWGGDDTLVGNRTSKASLGQNTTSSPPLHARTRSEFGMIDKSQQLGMGAAFPLLGMGLGYESHPHHHHQPSDDFPVGDGGDDFNFTSLSELDHQHRREEGMEEFGVGGGGGGGMAGVGTASRTSKIDSVFQRDSVVSAGTVVAPGERYSTGSVL